MRPRLLFCLVLGLSVVAPIRGDVVYLKDGYPLYGKVKREMEVIVDPATGAAIPVSKATNCFLLDDRVRFTVFGPRQVESADKDRDVREGHIGFVWSLGVPPRLKLPDAGRVDEPTPFNDKWERTLPVHTPNGKIVIKQKLVAITPYSARVESYVYAWTMNYLTAELNPPAIVALLKLHPDVKSEPPEFEKQFKVFRFCTQAGWFPEARAELNGLHKQFPAEKERLAQAETNYRQLLLQKTFEEADLAVKAGRHAHAEELLRGLPVTDMPPALQTEAANLKAKYDALHGRLDLARRLIAFAFDDVCGPPTALFAAAVPVLSRELNYDTLDRVEAFVDLAKQAEQAVRGQREPKQTREQLLTVLISGWALGPSAAEASEESAERVWSLREKLLAYQRIHVAPDRKKALNGIEQEYKMTIPEVAQAITLLPPPEREDTVGPRPSVAPERKTKAPWFNQGPYSYRVMLPPEYHANRAYPLLLILPNVGESTASAISAWGHEAARRGYIVAAVDWGTVKNKYEYSDGEHAAALACIRDIKRYLQVDSDRVFLTGFSEGGNMAFDVGLSHPDIFAGVVPINGRPQWYSSAWYWRNAQHLPFYIVCGELTSGIRTWDAAMFDKWVDKGYASLMVMYRGRVNEFYPGEIPFIFDWMSRKRRATGFPELGRNPQGGYQGEEYQTFRQTDNRFYWVTTDQVSEKFVLADFAHKPRNDAVSAAVQAVIREGNQVQVNTRGLKQVSLWFGRVNDPVTGVREMIDFTKPVKITLNRTAWNNKNPMLTPSLETMLEDFYNRGDRQRLFMVRVDFNNIP